MRTSLKTSTGKAVLFCYRMEHQRLGEELSTLQKNLELKELQIMKVTASSTQVETLRLQFEKHVRALENKRTKLERERQELALVKHSTHIFLSELTVLVETSEFESDVA